MYGLVAAIFIALRDVFSKDLINRYDYTDYIIVASALLFLGSLVYLFVSKRKVKVPDSKDLFTIIARLLIVYMIIEPCIFYSIKHCKNPAEAKSINSVPALTPE